MPGTRTCLQLHSRGLAGTRRNVSEDRPPDGSAEFLTWANQARRGTPDLGLIKPGQALLTGVNQVRTGENFTGRPHCGMLFDALRNGSDGR